MASRKYLKTEEGPESQLADSLETISYPQAFILGLVQALAVIPGVSLWSNYYWRTGSGNQAPNCRGIFFLASHPHYFSRYCL